MSIGSYANNSKFVVNLGLSRISELMERLGNPQNRIKTIHVAGTNGKGSVCAFLREMLTFSGFKTGLYSSPELCDIHERISIDGANISDNRLCDIFSRIEKTAASMLEKPSPFELWTAAAFLYFYEEGCDYSVIEVGMGGDEDATNVIEKPVLSVITRISIDHTAYLGKTIAEISRHKAGIIKKGAPVVSPLPENDVITAAAREKSAPLFYAAPLETIPRDGKEIYDGFPISLSGLNQAENAALAKKAAELLGLSNEAIAYGLSHASHRGRFELLEDGVIFDGAHNVGGAESLAKNLLRYYGGKKFTFIYAAMRDKEIEKILEILRPFAARFIFTTVPQNPRSATKDELSEIAKRLKLTCSYEPDPKKAREEAERPLIITGSLYLYRYII